MKTPPLDRAAAVDLLDEIRGWSAATVRMMQNGPRRSRASRDHLLELALASKVGDLAAVIVAVMPPPSDAMQPGKHGTLAEANWAAINGWPIPKITAGGVPIAVDTHALDNAQYPGPEIVEASARVPVATLTLYRDLNAAALQAVEASDAAETLGPPYMRLPTEWFDLLVSIAGKIEMEEPQEVLPSYEELAERHIEAIR